MACPIPPLDLPLHSDLRILAQCGRDFLRQAHQKATHSRRLPICRRSQGRHQPLCPGNQCRTKTLHLDRRSQPRPRRCQTRETSVRVDPLGSTKNPCSPTVLSSKPYLAAFTHVVHLASDRIPPPKRRHGRADETLDELAPHHSITRSAKCARGSLASPVYRPPLSRLRPVGPSPQLRRADFGS